MNRNKIISILSLCFLLSCKNEKPINQQEAAPVDSVITEVAVVIDTIPKKIAAPIPDYDTSQWVDMGQLDTSFVLDLRYATSNNFVKEQLYSCPRCFLRPKVAQVLLKIQKDLLSEGLRLKFFDCYRPLSIQQQLWNKVPDATYVTNPKKGSMHNRGLAVDLTFVDEYGVELDMGTDFDFFGRKAHHTHTDHTKEVLKNRRLLKSTMEAAGFKSIRTEWWHYSYLYAKYPLAEMEWECPER